MKNTKQLLEAIIRMNATASDEAMRERMNGVHVKASTVADVTTWRITSTDGHVMTRSVFATKATELKDADFIVPSDAMAKLKLFLKSLPKYVRDIEVTSDGARRVKFSCIGESVEILAPNVEFPDACRLLVPSEQRTLKIGLNPELLMAAFKAMNEEKRNTLIILSLDPENPLASIQLQCGENNGVLMPMRINQ